MPIDNPSVSGLLDKNILVINRQFENTTIIKGFKTSMSINETILEILELIDIDLSEKPTELEIEFAKDNRPEWTNRYY